MLRARRRDASIKPNRVLDRNSSRGMIYENEELRLRTININAEVERGQNDIKKLRMENVQLRREIWNLRDEYDRLQMVLRNKELSDDQESGEEEEDVEDDEETTGSEDQENASNLVKVQSLDFDALSVVVEDLEGEVAESERPRVVTFETAPSDATVPRLVTSPSEVIVTAPTHDHVPQLVTPPSDDRVPQLVVLPSKGGAPVGLTIPEDFRMSRPATPPNDATVPQLVSATVPEVTLSPATSTESSVGHTSAEGNPNQADEPQAQNNLAQFEGQQLSMSRPDSRCQPYSGVSPAYLRLNCVQPFTIGCSISGPHLAQLTAQEAIDSLSDQLPAPLMSSVRGIRLVGGQCFVSLSCQADVDAVLGQGLSFRNSSLLLHDVSVGTAVLALAGVPHDVADQGVAEVLAQFGDVIGSVERRMYRGVDTGERVARLRPLQAVPRSVVVGGCRVALRLMRDEEVAHLAVARRKSFRSQLHVRLQPLGGDLDLSLENSAATPTPTDKNSLYSAPRRSLGLSKEGCVASLSPADKEFLYPEPRQTGSVGLPSPQGLASAATRSQSTPTVGGTTDSCGLKPRESVSGSEMEVLTANRSPSPTRRQTLRKKPSVKRVPKSPTDLKKVVGESSSSGPDSPTKPGRRRGSLYFKRTGSFMRTPSSEQVDGAPFNDMTTNSERERSNSDVSSRNSFCRRRLSDTGRESGKVPWCGCWGNGCL